MAVAKNNHLAIRPIEEIVDFDWLRRYTGGDLGIESELLHMFEAQAETQIAGLRSLLGSGDGKSWHAASHTLKGAARSIGVNEICALAAALEEAGCLPNDAAALAKIQQLEDLLAQFCNGLALHHAKSLK